MNVWEQHHRKAEPPLTGEPGLGAEEPGSAPRTEPRPQACFWGGGFLRCGCVCTVRVRVDGHALRTLLSSLRAEGGCSGRLPHSAPVQSTPCSHVHLRLSDRAPFA